MDNNFYIMGRVFVPQEYNNLTNRDWLISKNNWGVALRAATGTWGLEFTITTGSGTYTAYSAAFSTTERWYNFAAYYSEDDDEIICWLDEDDTVTATSTAGTITAGTDDLVIGAEYDLTNKSTAIITDLRIYTGTTTRTAVTNLMREGAIPLDEIGAAVGDGLVANWRGDQNSGGTLLKDYGQYYDPTTDTSRLDATVTNVTEVSSFDGGEDLHNRQVMYPSGPVQNAVATNIWPEGYVWQLHGGGMQSMDWLKDQGVDLDLEAGGEYTSIINFYTASAPTTINDYHIYYPWSLIRTKTYDIQGTNSNVDLMWAGWPSAHSGGLTSNFSLDFDGVNDYVDFGTGYGTKLSQTFTLEFKIVMKSFTNNEVVLTNYDGTNGFRVFQLHDSTNPARLRALLELNGATLIATTSALRLDTPYHVSVSVTETSDTSLSLYVNGYLQESDSESGKTINLSSANFYLGRNRTGADFSDIKADDVRIWSTARTEQQIRDNLCALLTGTETGLTDLWRGTPAPSTTWNNRVSGGTSGTISGATWLGGISCPAGTLGQALQIAADHNITIDTSHLPSSSNSHYWLSPVTETFSEPIAVLNAIDAVLSNCNLSLVWDNVNGQWTIREFDDPASMTLNDTITEDQLLDLPQIAKSYRPCNKYEMGYWRITTTQGRANLYDAVLNSHRRLVAAELRFLQIANKIKDDPYKLCQQQYQIPSTFRYAKDARVEGRRQRDLRGLATRDLWEINLTKGMLDLIPGDVIKVEHTRLDGGSITVLIVETNDKLDAGATLVAWG